MEVDSWQRIQTKVFIDLWKKYPILYDSSHPDYNSKFLRNQTIRTIMKQLIHYKPNITLNGVKKKIRTLQSQFCKEKSKIILTNGKYAPSLWCYEDLSFLLNRPVKDKFQTEPDEHISEEEYINEILEDIKIVKELPNKKLKRDNDEDEEHIQRITYNCSPVSTSQLKQDEASTFQEELDVDDGASYLDGIQDYEFHEESLDQEKQHDRLLEKKTLAEINYYQRKAAYFSEMLENVKIERRLMNLKAHKLALEIKQIKSTQTQCE